MTEADTARATIARYYDAFNARDVEGMLATLDPDVAHHVNDGGVRIGKARFAEFLAHMNRCYDERLSDLVIFRSDDGSRGAAEFVVNGTYLETDPGLPPARGQSYRLDCGAFFTLRNGLITRVSTYYSMKAWLAQVAG